MRKGFVITLGVVALALVVSPGFAVAPIISCVPDIIVSDFEQSQTIDNNLFIFSNALDLDEYVTDSDTTDSSLLRWSFIRSSGPNLLINGVGSNTSGNVRDPGVFDIRAVSRYASIRNEDWSPVAGTMPYPNPPATSADSMIELYVSDGTNTGSQTVKITSIDESAAGPGDRLVPTSYMTFDFATQQGWTWYTVAGLDEPGHAYNSGPQTLSMTESAGGSNVVFGAWESPQDPAVIGNPRFGCVQRARFHVSSSVDGAACPGIRMRAVTGPVVYSGGEWIPNFTSQDFNSDLTVNFFTPSFGYVSGREPGTAGKVLDILNWPQQIASLMSTSVVTYWTCDLLDLDKPISGEDDAGVITISQVDIDGIDRPEAGSGTNVTALSDTDFSDWTAGVQPISGGTYVPPTVNALAGEVNIVVGTTAAWFDAAILSPATALDVGAYYRAIFTVSSTVPSTDFGPTYRLGFVSSVFCFSADKNLPGGGLLSAIGSTPEPFEVWVQGPPASAAQTEPISLRFQSYLATHNTGFPFSKDVSGTIRCTEVAVEQFPAPAEAPP